MPVDAELIKRRVEEARGCIAELTRLTNIPFSELSVDRIYSIRYNIIVLVESLVSVAVHILVEDHDYRPEYYSEALEQLASRLGLQPICVEELKALTRLRNLLIHRYWVISDKRIYEDIRGNFRCIEELLERIGERYGGDQVL